VLDTTATVSGADKVNDVDSAYDDFFIGRYENQFGDRFFNGDIAELRIASTARSTDWNETEANNLNDEATFWGTWTDVGGGGPASSNNSLFFGGGN
jgi:hypothetical protein